MVHRRGDNGGRARKGHAVAAALTSPFDFDVLHVEEGEAETLAALMEADAADTGAPQTRARRMHKEMATLERWLIENEEQYEAELGESLISSSPTGIDEDGGDDDDENDEDEDELRVPAVRATIGDPWLSHDSSAPRTTQRDGATPGFDDDFSAFVSAPAVSITSAAAASASAPEFTLAAAGTHGFLDTSVPMLLPSHTGGSYRSLRSGTSVFPSDVDDDLAGYEVLDDRSSFFSPEHEFDDADVDADTRTPVDRRLGGERVGLTDDLTTILASLQTMRENVAGIEDEAQRRATTARFASEFVFRQMGVDGGEREGARG
jgi:hypothetical protein